MNDPIAANLLRGIPTELPPRHEPAPAGHGPDFEALVGREGWLRLRGNIRRRFSDKPRPGRDIRYRGVMEKVECSWIGWIVAHLCRLIGTPFALHRGREIPTSIRLIDDGTGGVIWQREYAFAGRATVRVQSTKRGGTDGSLLECVGMGLGMRLAVFEANGDLHFLSLRYFWSIAGRTVWLPHLLSPGIAHIVHRDLGAGTFRFRMTIHHALFGTLFHQDGVFHDTARDDAGAAG